MKFKFSKKFRTVYGSTSQPVGREAFPNVTVFY